VREFASGVLDKLNLEDRETDSNAIDFDELKNRLTQHVSPAFFEPFIPSDAEVASSPWESWRS
jgi:hypothetical protein